MTLILARASAEFILQVTDRLVTHNKQPYDKVANKNILLITSNAVVTMAYTGDAYLDNIPTDYWLAKKLVSFSSTPENPKMMETFDQNVPWPDIGQALQTLRDELAGQNKKGLIISLQGWQWNSKGRIRPLVGYIQKIASKNTAHLCYEPRHWYWDGRAMTIATPNGNIDSLEQTELSNLLRHKTVFEAESLLVEKIRKISQHNSLVGPHCMSIFLPPPSSPNIHIKYFPADSSTLSESNKLADNDIAWAYSPWILSSHICLPPSQIVGTGFMVHAGIFSIHFESQTPGNKKLIMAHEGHKRRMWP